MKLKPVKEKGQGEGTASRLMAKIKNKDAVLISALSPFSHRDYACFVPFHLEHGRSRTTVVYDTTSLVALSSYVRMPVDSSQFVVMVESLLNSFAELDGLDVRIDLLMFDLDHVFMNTVRGSVAFLIGEDPAKWQDGQPAFDLFRALGALPQPETFEDRKLMGEYVAGIDAIRGQGLAAYRAFARTFVDGFRGVVSQVATDVKAPTQRFSRQVFYDAQDAAERANRDFEPVEHDGIVEMHTGGGQSGTLPGRAAPVAVLTNVVTGAAWEVSDYPYTMGVSPKADCRIVGNEWVSRMHAQLVAEGRRLYLEDLGSTNGTAVNGEGLGRGQRRLLSNGDVFELAGEGFGVSIRSR